MKTTQVAMPKSAATVRGPGLPAARGFGLEAPLRRSLTQGRKLPEEHCRRLAPDAGAELSAVRIHEDAESHRLNQVLSAKAFTFGTHIFFRRGAYQPATHQGRDLLSHELVHVWQQKAGRVRPGVRLGDVPVSADEGLEREANRSGLAGLPATIGPSPPQACPGGPAPGVVQRAGIRVSEIPNLSEEDRQSFLRIQGLLSDPHAYLPHLQALSQEVGHHEQFAQDPQAALHAVLSEHERQQGFAADVPTLTGFVSPEEFSGLVRRGIPFHDLGAAAPHGPATHRIQWNVIGRAMAQARAQEAPWPGAETTADLYARTASERYRITTPTGGGSAATHYPWDALVDRVGANPAGGSSFVTFAEQEPEEGAAGTVNYRGRTHRPLPRDAGVPVAFSESLRDPTKAFGSEHGLDALSAAVTAGFNTAGAAQATHSEESLLAAREQQHGQFTSALTRLPGLRRYGGKVAYANEAQYLASPQAWRYQQLIPRGVRTAASTVTSGLARGAWNVISWPFRGWRR